MSQDRELAPQDLQRAQEIREAAAWQRCWHCYCAPCRCPEGQGLGPLRMDGAALAPGALRKLKQDPEMVRPAPPPAPKRRSRRAR